MIIGGPSKKGRERAAHEFQGWAHWPVAGRCPSPVRNYPVLFHDHSPPCLFVLHFMQIYKFFLHPCCAGERKRTEIQRINLNQLNAQNVKINKQTNRYDISPPRVNILLHFCI